MSNELCKLRPYRHNSERKFRSRTPNRLNVHFLEFVPYRRPSSRVLGDVVVRSAPQENAVAV